MWNKRKLDQSGGLLDFYPLTDFPNPFIQFSKMPILGLGDATQAFHEAVM